MEILFLNAYFMPETIAFSHLEKDLIEELVSKGHRIEVVSPIPTRNISKALYKKYKNIKTEEMYNGQVHIRRFYAPRERSAVLFRAFRYFWCNVREYQIVKKYKGVDVIFATSTPPTQGLLAGMLAKKMKCRFIYSLQDIFPDSLVTTGLTEEGSLIWRLGRWIEQKTYEYAEHVVVISNSCKKNLLKKGVKEEKISLISNWVDTENIKPILREDNRLFSEFQINPKKFVVVYAGNFGAAQGADIVLKAAEKLITETEIQFVIFGGGAEYGMAVKYVEDKNLTNVIIHPLLSQDRVSEVYSLADVALITAKSGVGNNALPSKLWNIMSCNTFIIASFDADSDMAEILKESEAGRCVEAGNVEALAQEIICEYKNNSSRRDVREYVKIHADKQRCVSLYMGNLIKH